MSEIAAQLLPVVAAVLASLVAALGAAALRWLKLKLEGDCAKGVLERVEKLALPAVAEQWQTTVADLKEAASDGKLTKAEAADALEAARARVRQGLGRSGLKTAEKIFGREELEKIIRTKLEASVVELSLHLGQRADLTFTSGKDGTIDFKPKEAETK